MGSLPPAALARRLPLVLLATFAVVGLPLLAVSALRASGLVTSFLPLVAVGVILSIVASYLGAKIWALRPRSEDVLFADLMLWGWLKRWRLERQLASAVGLLGLDEKLVSEEGGDDSPELDADRRVRLLKQLSTALEARHPDTHGHSRRVARHAAVIAKRMGLPAEEVAKIRTAGAVHDVGKIDIAIGIINKPGKLTDSEFAAIKEHSTIGAKMVSELDDEELTQMVRHHHERLDGKGYPDRLEGDEIPLGARIIAVADTFDAVTSSRPYRSARRHKDALSLLNAEGGTQLDPDAVQAFRAYYTGYRPVALWALLVNGPRQFIASLAGEVKLGGVAAAATLATTAAGTVAVHSFHADHAGPPAAGAEVSATNQAPIFASLSSGLFGAKHMIELESSRVVRSGVGVGFGNASSLVDFAPGAKPEVRESPASASSPDAESFASGSSGGDNSGSAEHTEDVTERGDSSEPAESGNDKGSGGSRSDDAAEKGNSAEHGNSSGKGNSGGNSATKGNSAEHSNSPGNEGEKGNSGGNVSLPEQASDNAKAAVEGVVKGGGSQSQPESTPATPAVEAPKGPPAAPPKGPPPGKGKGSSSIAP